MSTGLKVWLWFMFIANIVGACMNAVAIAVRPICAALVVMGIVSIAGVVLILFKQKKLGFYIMVGAAAVGIIINVIAGTNIILALILAVIAPTITYLLMKKNWNEFQ